MLVHGGSTLATGGDAPDLWPLGPIRPNHRGTYVASPIYDNKDYNFRAKDLADIGDTSHGWLQFTAWKVTTERSAEFLGGA